jgi:hypothetical protein
MNLFFEDNTVKRIAFITKPEAKFVPPKEWKEDLQQLDGFRWRITEKPYLQTILKRVEYQDLVKKP